MIIGFKDNCSISRVLDDPREVSLDLGTRNSGRTDRYDRAPDLSRTLF